MDRLRLDNLLCAQRRKDRIENCAAQLCPRQQQQYRWCAIPLSGLNCPLRGTKYLPSENPISKRAANPNWWRRWRGEVELLGRRVYQMQHISVGETTFPAWLKGSIGVCIHGEVRRALYHNMRTNTSTKDLRVQKKNTKAHVQLNVSYGYGMRQKWQWLTHSLSKLRQVIPT